MTRDDDPLKDLPAPTEEPKCAVHSQHEGHYPSWAPAPKMDSPWLCTGVCSCGWRSTGLANTWEKAMKISRAHADAKNAVLGLVRVSLHVSNTYELYDEVVCTFEDELITVPPGEEGTQEYQDWQMREIIDRFTGVGLPEGDSWYDVQITDSSDPELIGREFDWGY